MKISNSNKIALISENKEVSYSELINNIHYYAGLIPENKVKKAIIFADNSPEWIYSFYAIWEHSAVVIPVDAMSTPKELAYILSDSKPELIFFSENKQQIVDLAIEKSNISDIITINIDKISIDKSKQCYAGLREYLASEIAVIIYTSGTTGKPKGVMLSYNNIETNIKAVTDFIPIYTPQDRIMVLLPLHHVFPLVGSMIIPLSTQATCVFAPSLSSGDIISTLQNHQISIIIGVPRLYSLINKGIQEKIKASFVAKLLFALAGTIKSMSFSRTIFKSVHKKFGGNLKYLISGGAALDPKVAKDFYTLGFEILEGYGMTETAPMISFTRPGNYRQGFAGQVLPGCEVEIIDGEITVTGDNVMQGYYNKPEDTAEIIRNGRLYTGDLGELHDGDFLKITGRKKEIIVLSNGKNINPVEIEFEILEMTDIIHEIGVFMHNDTLQAVIVPNEQKVKEQQITNIEEFIKWNVIEKYNKESAQYKRILNFVISKEELPKTRLSKIQRFKLIELAEGRLEKDEMPDIEEKNIKLKEYHILKEFLESEKNTKVSPTSHLEIDLALDSLDKVGLQVFIETSFGIKIDVDELTKFKNILELAEFIHKSKTKTKIEKIDWQKIVKEKINWELPKPWKTAQFTPKIGKYLLKLFFKFEVSGLDYIPASPFILAPNHQSFLDGLIVAGFLKRSILKDTYFYTKAKYAKSKLLKTLANKHNLILVDVNQELKFSIQKLAEILKNGKNIVIFPEGTRTHTGDLGDFKKTFAILSAELNVPVIPVTINGAFKILPRGKKIPKIFKKIELHFHKPIKPEGMSYDTITEEVKKQIQNKLMLD